MDTKIVHYRPRVLLRGYQLSVSVPKVFFISSLPSLNLLNFH